ncbi:hypothetical protein [Kitasatospora sp. MBT66]|uniref:hypothetical protein n=1 Tax=Kitasatospora sp. MBT66 TaxID=1444769 RepID=UPI0013148FD0|nr:hypothetical protein [Kitasatospora sp. MBT66]
MEMQMVRVFWKCRTKGCKVRAVTDLPRIGKGTALLIGSEPGQMVDIHYWMFADTPEKAAEARELYASHGALCADHGPMEGQHLNARYRAEKVCDGRCLSAKSAACECSCGGENHGQNFI